MRVICKVQRIDWFGKPCFNSKFQLSKAIVFKTRQLKTWVMSHRHVRKNLKTDQRLFRRIIKEWEVARLFIIVSAIMYTLEIRRWHNSPYAPIFEGFYLRCFWTEFHVMGFIWKLGLWSLNAQYFIELNLSTTEKSDEQRNQKSEMKMILKLDFWNKRNNAWIIFVLYIGSICTILQTNVWFSMNFSTLENSFQNLTFQMPFWDWKVNPNLP